MSTTKLSNFLNTSLVDPLDSADIINLMNQGTTDIPIDSGTTGDYVKLLIAGKGINLADSQGHATKPIITVDSAEVAYLTSTQTLTNKTINLTSNTLAGTRAQFQTSMSDDNFVTEAGQETMTNKILTAPIISLNASNTQTGTVGITGPGTIQKISSFGLRDTTTTNYQTLLASTSSVALTADRTLTLDIINADKTLSLGANFTIGASSGNISMSANNNVSFTFADSGSNVVLVGTNDTIQSAKALDSAQNFSITGDVTAPAVAFNGTSAVALASTLGAGKVYNANINAAAAIVDTKLATISTAGKVSNSATSGVSTNTANTLVLRDAQGDFAANEVTAYDFRVAGYGAVVDSAGVWVGSTEGVKGETGAGGTKGEKGTGGTNGTNGDKGQKGEVGGAGDKGQKGEVGGAGGDGNDGDKGQKGELGDKGAPSSVAGAKGAPGGAGDKGQKGEIGSGDKGEKGASAGTTPSFTSATMTGSAHWTNDTSGYGLYNSATSQYFYSDDDDYWNIAGGTGANAIRFRDEYNGTIRNYLYSDQGNNIGFLNSNGEWLLKCGAGDGSSPSLRFIEGTNTSWTGDPGSDEGKIEYHSDRFYIAAGSNSNRVCQFRRGGGDVSYVDNSGVYNGTATSARWADVAERYEADDVYEPGTVLGIGGDKEVTLYKKGMPLAGAVSTQPGIMMNNNFDVEDDDSEEAKRHPYIALAGRIPLKINGSAKKGDYIIADNDGKGVAVPMGLADMNSMLVIGIALEDGTDVVEVKV